jgi:hypothetical protein
MNRRALVSGAALVGLVLGTSLLAAPPKPTNTQKEPVQARTDIAAKMARVEGTVTWPQGPGNPTATGATEACAQVQVSASKETPSGGPMPNTETLAQTTGKPVDAANLKKGCTYALSALPTAQPLKVSARFTGPWSTPLGGGGVWSSAATLTLKPGTVKQNLALVVNAIK